MKKALTQTIIVFVAINLTTAGFALAQNVSEEEAQPASKEVLVAEKQAELARKKADISEKVAQKEAEVAQRQMEVAQKQMEVAQKEMETKKNKLQVQLKQLLDAQTQAKISPSPPDIYTITSTVPQVRIQGLPWQHNSSGTVLVIPAAQMKVEGLVAITADMSIMSRIFDKKLSQARLTTRGSWPIGFDSLAALGRSSGATEAIYLEGYGALFLMKVNVLLSPPPETQQEKETKEEDTDPLWTETIQEMYAPQEVNRNIRRRIDRPEEKYDAEKVEELKETLIKTLKHAANIRVLKPDESVILTVTGKTGQSATTLVTRVRVSIDGHRKDIITGPAGAGSGSLSPMVLTIRAKKADIDAFAKGQYDFDQFRQRTQLLLYPYLGESMVGPSRSFPTNIILKE